MTTEEIIEGNKLIAGYMGKEFLNKEEYTKETGCPKEEKINMPDCNCFYHDSWNWIVPVYSKAVGEDDTTEAVWDLITGFDTAIYNNRVDNAFEAVVKYLKAIKE